ncbi:hypothetical protein GCM10010520_68160 [Rhizobium viscosum]|uniref:Amino acid transporter n=1 Tax=Rhizobium viscosum TaxID=1673 RepID=A0ABR9ITX5_RHIVS|nr:amino acid transporter [Rhizobium viscosum]MBE1506656.1 hypothetical protein [Rhizobium viscosum]
MKPLADDAWNPWHPAELMQRLDASFCWYVVGGWALDLWHGIETREHEDLEFAVLPEDLDRARALLGELMFFAVDDGRFEPLPAAARPPEKVMQFWGADIDEGCWRVDMMLERGTADSWVYKRDPAIGAPRAEMIRTSPGGIPYLAPEAVLLFKARHCREKDEGDFDRAVPKLDTSGRARLRGWLQHCHPGHDWIARL